ncbi:MAG: ABC transporter permease [Sphaerochaetaceae bacterium]|jgi:D-methionine transport system permease protein|nr:ABC transporter permease [Sphaerochaetaceae bacterium]MDC7243253.1 ABC transporter permease [Sphaerochaetaceae bacterium]
MNETLNIIQQYLGKATYETFQMVSISLVVATILGIIIGLLLYITSNPLLLENKVINIISSTLVNILRSIPFIILLVVVIPLTKLIVGTTIGPLAATVPLSLSATAFNARLIEGAFAEIKKETIESSIATGASLPLIIRKVLFVEALPSIIRAITVTFISLIGYSAMAGIVGGGGIGDLAIQFGYYRYETGIMIITVVMLVVIVQFIQYLGDKISRAIDHQ